MIYGCQILELQGTVSIHKYISEQLAVWNYGEKSIMKLWKLWKLMVKICGTEVISRFIFPRDGTMVTFWELYISHKIVRSLVSQPFLWFTSNVITPFSIHFFIHCNVEFFIIFFNFVMSMQGGFLNLTIHKSQVTFPYSNGKSALGHPITWKAEVRLSQRCRWFRPIRRRLPLSRDPALWFTSAGG